MVAHIMRKRIVLYPIDLSHGSSVQQNRNVASLSSAAHLPVRGRTESQVFTHAGLLQQTLPPSCRPPNPGPASPATQHGPRPTDVAMSAAGSAAPGSLMP